MGPRSDISKEMYQEFWGLLRCELKLLNEEICFGEDKYLSIKKEKMLFKHKAFLVKIIVQA